VSTLQVDLQRFNNFAISPRYNHTHNIPRHRFVWSGPRNERRGRVPGLEFRVRAVPMVRSQLETHATSQDLPMKCTVLHYIRRNAWYPSSTRRTSVAFQLLPQSFLGFPTIAWNNVGNNEVLQRVTRLHTTYASNPSRVWWKHHAFASRYTCSSSPKLWTVEIRARTDRRLVCQSIPGQDVYLVQGCWNRKISHSKPSFSKTHINAVFMRVATGLAL